MPARLATSSRLTFAPDRVKAFFAIPRMRSRLRCASARGFRGAGWERFISMPKIIATGEPLRLSLYCGDCLRFIRDHGSGSIAVRMHLEFPTSRRMRMAHVANVFGATSTTEEVLSGINLRGKRILVTGVSAGIGVETARSLAAHGAQVVGAARDLKKAEAATAFVRKESAD